MTPLSKYQTDRVRASTDLPNLIGNYVRLRRSGTGRLVGLCPFHKEATPSFTVYVDHYHCFGCQESGTCFDFVMKIDGLSFVAARQYLADRAGIVLRDESPADRAAARRQQLYAEQLAREAQWWWRIMRRKFTELETVCYSSAVRAERWISDRMDEERAGTLDTMAADWAWFWLWNGERMAEMMRTQVDVIDNSQPGELVNAYVEMTKGSKVRAAVVRNMAEDAKVDGLIREAWGIN